jgi:uridine kinase
VAVGGLARSGKSTAAAALAREARLQNLPCTTVHLDQWIRPVGDRLDVPAPWDAYPQERLERELTSFLQQGQPIVAPGYALHAHAEPTEKRYTPASVVLVEGVVALSLESVRTAAHWTLSVSTSPIVRRERFDRFMAWRGRSHEAEALWNLRERTEVPTVEKDLIFAETTLLL